MHKLVTTIAAVAALSAAGFMTNRAEAAPLAHPSGMHVAVGDLDMTMDVQLYVYDGTEYCWYDDGWSGPGWYWCGHYLVPGIGYGGPLGWRGWVWRGGGRFGGGRRGGGRFG